MVDVFGNMIIIVHGLVLVWVRIIIVDFLACLLCKLCKLSSLLGLYVMGLFLVFLVDDVVLV